MKDTICPQCLSEQGLDEVCWKCSTSLAPVANRFLLRSKIGAGGFGVIFLAEDLQTNKDVVIKLLKADAREDEQQPIRFRREIRVTQELHERNPHAVALIAHGEAGNLGMFYAMEYLKGRTLHDMLREESSLSLQDIFSIFGQLAEVLSDAHALGIIHRDLKPPNVYLIETPDNPNFVKLLDFGLAKSLAGTLHQGLTVGMVGTPAYMAPEQCTNKEIDARTDIYALGLLLYEMLMGTPPFKGNSLVMLASAQMSEPPEPFASRRPDLHLPAGLQEALFKALEKMPENRYQSMSAFADAVRPFGEGQASALQLVTRPEPKKEPIDELPAMETVAATITIDSGETLASEASHRDGSAWYWVGGVVVALVIILAVYFIIFGFPK